MYLVTLFFLGIDAASVAAFFQREISPHRNLDPLPSQDVPLPARLYSNNNLNSIDLEVCLPF